MDIKNKRCPSFSVLSSPHLCFRPNRLRRMLGDQLIHFACYIGLHQCAYSIEHKCQKSDGLSIALVCNFTIKYDHVLGNSGQLNVHSD